MSVIHLPRWLFVWRYTVFACMALAAIGWGGIGTGASSVRAADLEVGFAEADITPDVKSDFGVWLAGYGMGRKATGVHDPLVVRTVVLRANNRQIALCCVDLVGLQYPEVRRIRERLAGFDYVMVSSTHNHEAPDVIGIWGKSPLQRGVDDRYLDLVVERTCEAVQKAQRGLKPAQAAYGTASDESLLGDSRLPKVKDGVLRAIRFTSPEGQLLGLLVQWNCHPEALGSRNTLVTADFPWATVAALRAKYSCPVAYFTGAIGGLMAPPDGRILDASGKKLDDGNFEYAERYGEEVAQLVVKAVDGAQPITLTPFAVAAKPVAVPVDNKVYRAARAIGVLKRAGFLWTGDSEKFGEPYKIGDPNQELAIETEVACLKLGQLQIACIPGELYPELVYGQFQEPADPAADYPDAPLETPVAKLLTGDKWLLFGLANDEVGYIIPRRQWDEQPPYAYGRDKSQYGEINSCGARTAPVLMEALRRRVAELKEKP